MLNHGTGSAASSVRVCIIALLLCSTPLVSFAGPVDHGVAVRSTPYDPFMEPVFSVLASLDTDGADPDLKRVRELMKICYRFEYVFRTPFIAASPHVTETKKSGDCKDKALWLIEKLNDDSVRFVIGKSKAFVNVSHAWVMWNDGTKWWILDATLRSKPVRADRIRRGEYIPQYSFGRDGAREHEGASKSTDPKSLAADSEGDQRTWRRFFE